MAQAEPSGNRRGALILGAAAVSVLGLPPLLRRLRGPADLGPHPSVPGFRQAGATAISGGIDPFAGIVLPDDNAIAPVPPDDLCAALFEARPGGTPVTIAVFTDINCPHCRAMDPAIAALDPDRAQVTWHDLPKLGPGSRAAARAIAAAEAQGGALALRRRLNRTRFQPDPGYLRTLAAALGLDADRLLADMASPAVTAQVAGTLGLAERLAIPGTPALVIGDIVAVGRRDRTEIDALIAASRPPPCSP